MNTTSDWYDVNQINENSYRISEADHYYSYLLAGEDIALLIDTGTGVGDLHEVVHHLVETPVRVLLTHSHWDHIGNAYQFDRIAINNCEQTADGRVTVDVLGDMFDERIPEALEELHTKGVRYTGGLTPDEHTIPPVNDVNSVEPGERLDIGGRTLELVDIAGHSPGQLGVLDRQNGDFYGADLVGSDRKLLVHFPGSDLDAYLTSLKRLLTMYRDSEFDTLLTGHNGPIESDELGVLETLQDSITTVLDDEVTPEKVELTTGQAEKYKLNGFRIFATPSA